MNNKISDDMPFERAIERLDAIVKRLETQTPSLEEALALYEEGVILTKFCSCKLEEAEKKVAVLTEKNGSLSLQSLAEDNLSSD